MMQPPSRRRTLSSAERELWRQVVKDVEPLPGHEVPVEPVVETVAETAAVALAVPDIPLKKTVAKPERQLPLPPLQPGSAEGLDRRTNERLRRGQMEIQGRIDLHGMTQDVAHSALLSFIHRSWNEGRRCVLVITGKGNAGGGILRQSVPRWLAEVPVRPMILSITSAQPKDGGAGALYVLLKRKRQART